MMRNLILLTLLLAACAQTPGELNALGPVLPDNQSCVANITVAEIRGGSLTPLLNPGDEVLLLEG